MTAAAMKRAARSAFATYALYCTSSQESEAAAPAVRKSAAFLPIKIGCRSVKTLTKLSLVPLGYLAAILAAPAAVCIRQMLTRGPDADASSGMYAFGDLLGFVAVFGLLSLAPMAWLLVMLRPCARFWSALSIVSLAAAIAGPVFAVVMQHRHPDWFVTALLFIAEFLGAPLLAIAFLTVAAIAPNRRARRMLFAAGFVEGAVSIYSFVCLFILQRFPI
jgi:hypothetical protein